MRNKTLHIKLDKQTFQKINECAVTKCISMAHVMKTLVERSDIKINLQQYETIENNKKDRRREYVIRMVLSEELLTKMNNMRLHNNIYYNEIVTQLVMQADLNSMTFRGMQHKVLNIKLYEQIFKKINKFTVIRGISLTNVIKTLVEKSNIKIDVQQYKTRHNKRRRKGCQVSMSGELLTKMNNMRLHNNITYNEIVNQLVMQADLNNMHFRAKREKEKIGLITVSLDATTDTKIRKFISVRGLYLSQVIRALIKKSSIKITELRNKIDVINNSKQKDKIDLTTIVLILPKPLLIKLRKMSLKNGASCSEIIRVLIDRTDLDSLKIKTKIRTGETLKIPIKLDDFTNKKTRKSESFSQ